MPGLCGFVEIKLSDQPACQYRCASRLISLLRSLIHPLTRTALTHHDLLTSARLSRLSSGDGNFLKILATESLAAALTI
jgi:hypothetical protein